MKYIIDIPKNILEEAKLILNKGEYKNINELIVTSLENQIMLESGEKIQEYLLSTAVKVSKSSPRKVNKKKEEQDYQKWLSVKNINNIKTYRMPEIKKLVSSDTNYEDLWMWGQVNRIFPIKVGLRILCNMQKEKGDFIILDDFYKKAGEVARYLGQQLKIIDNQLKRKRDKQVSTALPIGKNEEKTLWRYVTQFLVIKRTSGILDGAMARLKFINIQSLNNNKYLIGLTKEGIEFTKLINPILEEDLHSEKTLSDEEADFYIQHIKNHVPGESNPFKHILQIIENGVTEMTKIDKELKKIMPEWSDSVITTQRSGTLGRMNELGLLNRTKKGIKVTYNISEKGKNFLMIIKN